MVAQIRIEGLDELRRELRAVDPKLAKELTRAHRQVGKMVEEPARQEMASQPIPKAAEAAEGIRTRVNQTSVSLALLASNLWVRAAEFGAITHQVFGRSVLAASMKRRVFQPWKGNAEDAGYALFPTIRRVVASSEFEDVYFDALERALAQAFPGKGS